MSILPVNNIINVTVTTTPSGLTEKNVNSLALFTNETPATLGDYAIFISATQVAEEYGTNSLTAQMANAIFAQSPNLRSGNGRLVIIPLQGSVSATQGDFTTGDISANVEDILLVSDGDLNVNVDGDSIDLTGLDFTNASDLDDVATILNGLLVDVIVTAPTTSTLKFTSKKLGDDSDITIGAVAGGTGTDLAGAGYFDSAGGTATSGADSTGETILEAIARTEGAVGYVPVITSLQLEDDAILAISNGIQAQDRIFLHQVATTTAVEGIATTIADATNTKTRVLGYFDTPQTANLMKSAYAGRAFSVNFRGSNTAQTMHLKALATITPDLNVSQTLYENAKDAGVDLYVSFDGVSSVQSNGGNDFFDNVYSDLALKFFLETAGFNYLRQTNTKVPQTEAGMDGLKSAYEQVLVTFRNAGYVAGGTWTSSETFGDPETFRQNVLDNGYYIYSLPITLQDSVEREQRKAPLVQIAVKRAGAIHTSDVLVNVND